MIPGGGGTLVKMTIFAYIDIERRIPANPPLFKVMYNPNKYSRQYQADFYQRRQLGDPNPQQVYSGIQNQTYNFELVVDGTNASPPAGLESFTSIASKNVRDRVDDFLKLAGAYQGDLHRPNYLKLVWGTSFTLSCVLASATIDYTLFNSVGIPLRAKISATFTEGVDPNQSQLINRPQSPDLTELQQVEEQDNLGLMSFEAYDDPQYYIQVARHNGLKNFRRLRVGNTLEFPPIRLNNGGQRT